MKNLRRILCGATLLASFVSVPAAQAEEYYPRCWVTSTYGAGTLTPGPPGPGRGTGTLKLTASYTDSTNRWPSGVHVEYWNNSTYRAGATDTDYTLTMTVNGSPSGTTPKTKSPTYYYHADFWGGISNPFWRPWVKGDLVTARMNVTFHPTLNSGYTEATCSL